MASLNRQERHLITIQGLYIFASALANIFVTVFLFAHSDLRTTILYRTWVFAALVSCVIASGWSLKRVSSGWLMKLALAADALYYLLLFFLRGAAISFLLPLALLEGFGAGNFWAAFNLNQYIYSNRQERVRYFGWVTSVVNMLSAAAPALGGVIITVFGARRVWGTGAGYPALFFVVFVISVLMIMVIGRLPSHDMPLFSYRDLFHRTKTRAWRLVLGQQALLGLFDVAFGTVSGILMFLIVKQELWLGITQTAGFLLSAVMGIVSARLLKKYAAYFWVGSVGLALSIILFALMQNWVGLTCYIVISGITGPFLSMWISTVYFHTVDATPGHWRDKYHLFIERDTALGVMRVVSFVALYIYLIHGDQIALVKMWLLILPLIPVGIGILLWQSGKKSKEVSLLKQGDEESDQDGGDKYMR